MQRDRDPRPLNGELAVFALLGGELVQLILARLLAQGLGCVG
jgi:hypothetical protein